MKRFFPNQSDQIMQAELLIRIAAKNLSEHDQLKLFAALSNTSSSFSVTEFLIENEFIIAEQNENQIHFPRPVPLIKLSHILFNYEEWLRRKYCLPGFVEVEPGDIVIDCGAYIGGFSLSAARVAAAVHTFEPDRANFRCVEQNLKRAPNVYLNQRGLMNESGIMALNISDNSVEHSFLMPDNGKVCRVEGVEVVSLDDYCIERSIDHLDFVKIEAEGVEIEVFEGLQELKPSKFAIDVSPERNGISPAKQLQKRLRTLGYETRQRGQVLFAKHQPKRPVARAKAFNRNQNSLIPKRIYSLWLQGSEGAPELVQTNFNLWRELNPDYHLTILDWNDVVKILAPRIGRITDITPQALSDIVRSNVLAQSGGVWVDATLLPSEPLDRWLPDLVQRSGFFAFADPGPGRLLSSWFLAASADSPIMQGWHQETMRYWTEYRSLSEEDFSKYFDDPALGVSPENATHTSTHPYFWFHYLFAYALQSRPELADIWHNTEKVSANGPHRLQFDFEERSSMESSEILDILRESPVHKMNWRNPYPVPTLAKLIREMQTL